jgi:hypothetical protein
MAAKKSDPPAEVVELEYWDGEPEGEDDELDESGDEVDFAKLDDEGNPVTIELEEVADDDFERRRRAMLPQPDKGRSEPNLPKVKSSAFTRFLK